MKCKRVGCDNEVTRPQMAYCSAEHAPLAALIKRHKKPRKQYEYKDLNGVRRRGIYSKMVKDE